MEFAWVDEKTVQDTTEELIREVFREVMGVDLGEFPRMTYAEAMRRPGSDKPDPPLARALGHVPALVKGRRIQVFTDWATAHAHGVGALLAPGAAPPARTDTGAPCPATPPPNAAD